ncbi:MAG: hypothetical protein AAFP07_04435 [Cyanobacteria bacterium J06606_4]
MASKLSNTIFLGGSKDYASYSIIDCTGEGESAQLEGEMRDAKRDMVSWPHS